MSLLLNMTGGIAMNNLNLLILITNADNEKKHLCVLDKYKPMFKLVTYGVGTASSSLLEYFGLNTLEKKVIFTVLPRITSKYALLDLQNDLNKHGAGIAFTIPLSSSTKYMQEVYKEDIRKDVIMDKTNQHLIITITNEGYADAVMTAAKKAGAMGGTTISGRGLETDKVVKFLGISIVPEKDVVLILASDEIKNNIMNSIVNDCGLKTEGAGICFSLPVEDAVGLKKELNIK